MATLTEIKATTTWLQGIGATAGKPAGEVAVGDVLVWNYGHTSEVVAVRPVGKASVEISAKAQDGKVYARRFRVSRIVGCQTNGKTFTYSRVTQFHLRSAEVLDAAVRS